MSFWNEDHPLQDKYNILWKRHVPSCGECKDDVAEAMRLVNGVYYQLFNNGTWFANEIYHVKLYMKKDFYSPADNFMWDLDYKYEQEDWDETESFDERCDTMDWYMGEVVDWAWKNLADEEDEKKLQLLLQRKNKKRRREENEEVKLLKEAYKKRTGKRFKRKNGSKLPVLEALRKCS